MKLHFVLLLSIGHAALFSGPAAAEPQPPKQLQPVIQCFPDEHGRLSGLTVLQQHNPAETSKRGQVFPAPWATIVDNGPSSGRVDVVIVGDGFTAAELPVYRQRAAELAAALLTREPFASYAGHFNVHVVDVVSQESGISNDPQGVVRNTALDMTMWCSGIERAVCVTIFKAFAYARNAPDVDQVIAIGNTGTYGGAAMPASNLAVLTAFNFWSDDVLVHEFGHSFGKLADEYVEGEGSYSGPEFSQANISILPQASMLVQMAKWWRWFGAAPSGFDGPVSTFEGAHYTPFGIYRPTPDSLMRSLGRLFNPPSAEELVRRVHLDAAMLDSATSTCCPFTDKDVVVIEPVHPGGGDLSIDWTLNNLPLGVGGATTIDIGALGLSPGLYTLRVTVSDPTALVRDPVIRFAMTQTRTWSIDLRTSPADLNGDGRVNSTDLGILLGSWGPTPSSADLDGDGEVDAADLASLLGSWG